MPTPPNFIKSPQNIEKDTEPQYHPTRTITKKVNSRTTSTISSTTSKSNNESENHIQITKKTRSIFNIFSWGSTNSSFNEEISEILGLEPPRPPTPPTPKTRKEISLYRKSHLPKEGWIQACFLCYTYTSDTLFVKEKEYPKYILEFTVYVCDSCQHGILPPKEFDIELSNMVDEYIDDYLILP